MSVARADTVIERHRRRLKSKGRRITIELDSTDDPSHGAPQLAFSNGHYDPWCYLPVVELLTFNEDADQYLFAYVLNPGDASAGVCAVGILLRQLHRRRASFRRARLQPPPWTAASLPPYVCIPRARGFEYVVAMEKTGLSSTAPRT